MKRASTARIRTASSIRQSIAIPAQLAVEVERVARKKHLTISRALVVLVQRGVEKAESDFQGDPLAAVEEPLESEQPAEGAAFHAGALEHAAGAGLVLEGILPTVLDLQTAMAREAASAQMDELGHAIETGTIQGIRTPVLRIPQRRELHRSHLSLLRPIAAAGRTLITLFG
jgi:hypothetical protein